MSDDDAIVIPSSEGERYFGGATITDDEANDALARLEAFIGVLGKGGENSVDELRRLRDDA